MKFAKLAFVTVGAIGFAATSLIGGGPASLFRIQQPEGESRNSFGIAVALSENTVIIGAPDDPGTRSDSGAVYLYDLATRQVTSKIHTPTPGRVGLMGWDVAVSESIAVFGAPFDSELGHQTGAAYIFDTDSKEFLFKLDPEDTTSRKNFGTRVGISGTTAIVGAQWDTESGARGGAAYLFDASTGQQQFKLLPPALHQQTLFGTSVACSETIAVVGAPYSDENGRADAGCVYLFDTTTGEQIMKITPTTSISRELFGSSVAIKGNTILVGAIQEEVGAGAAYLIDATTGSQIFKLKANDPWLFDQFGYSVAIGETTLIVGARKRPGVTNLTQGAAYIFSMETGRQIEKIVADDGRVRDHFGSSVAINGSVAVVGTVTLGAAYVFDAGHCIYDINHDGVSDTADLGILIQNFHTQAHDGDLDRNGIVEAADLGMLISGFGTVCP